MTQSRFQFSGFEDEKLLEFVAKYPAIYDSSHDDYKNQVVRDNIWIEISEKVSRSVEDCKKRWRSIRDTYNRHKRNIKIGTGSSAKPKPSKWSLSEQLSFLNNVEQEKCTVSSIPTPEWRDTIDEENEASTVKRSTSLNEIHDSVASSSIEDANSAGQMTTVQGVSSETADGKMEVNDTVRNVTYSAYKKKKVNENIVQLLNKRAAERMEIMKEIYKIKGQNEKEDDPVDVFFKSMALTVKRLPPASIVEAKMKICSIVTELELRAQQSLLQPPSDSPSRSTHESFCSDASNQSPNA